MELPCLVEYVAFRNEKGFAIMSCNLDPYSKKYTPEMEDMVKDCISKKYNSFTVSIGMLAPGEDPRGGQYVFIGDFVTDKKYGRQFKAGFYYQDAPTTEEGLKTFLMSLPNIKESRSQDIIDKFGLEGTIDILDNDIYRLTEINGITPKRIPPIQKSWDEKKHLRELYSWLTVNNIPVAIADSAYKKWGKDAQKTISENPYKLVEIRGVGFLTADKYAHQIKKDIPTEYRVTACIRYILEESISSNSNLCVPYINLKKSLVAILAECDNNLGKKVEAKVYLDSVAKCLKSNLDTFTVVKDLIENQVYIYLRKIWNQEYYITKSLHNRKVFNHAMKECSFEDIEKAESKLESWVHRKIELDDCQKQAIKSAFEHKITVITGAGGTGKSMICRCIFSIAQDLGLRVRMMSPTGKAAQVLSEKTGCGASTIHRSLKLKPGDDVPRENIREDILLVDEISMSGIDTMYALMYALEGNQWANIVFVGDKNQLPSVSPGNFLSDIIESGCANVITLNKIHRQDEGSYISLIANEISKGKSTMVPSEANDITWHNLHVDSFHSDIIDFIDKYLSMGNDIEDLQVISPMKKGECGVYKLNDVIQVKMADINGTANDVLVKGFHKYHKGDRVIQLENNYDKFVFNGDMGTVIDLGERVIDSSVSDKKEHFLTVSMYGENVNYYGDEIDQLQLAWCITVHKFQGSQSKNIIFVMSEEAQIMMSKELVYTAFTRAEKKLDIFGHESMLRIAPTRSIIRKRYTSVKRITEDLKGGQKVLEVLEKQEEAKK